MKSARCILLRTSAVPALELSMITGLKICASLRKLSSAMSATRFSLKDIGTKQQGQSDVLTGPALFDVTLHSSVLFFGPF